MKSEAFEDYKVTAAKLEEKTGIGTTYYNEADAGILAGIDENTLGQFDGNKVSLVEGRAGVQIAIHEYSHALIRAIRNVNSKLWESLKQEIDTSPNGKSVREYILETYPNHKRNLELAGIITENAYDEMVVTLLEAYADRRLSAETDFGILKSYIKEKGNRLHDLIRNDVFVEKLNDLNISDLADIITLGKGKINIKDFLESIE